MTINQLTILNNKRYIIKSSDSFVNLVIHLQKNTACTAKVIKHLNEILFDRNKNYSVIKKIIIINQYLKSLMEFNINRIINYIKLKSEVFIKSCHKNGGSFYFPLDDVFLKPVYCKFHVNEKYVSISGNPKAYELFKTRNNGKNANFKEWSHIIEPEPLQGFKFNI